MSNAIAVKLLILLCLCTGTLKAQTLALFRVVDNGDTRIYDSTAHSYLTYNMQDTIITNRHIVRSAIDASAPYGAVIKVKLNDEGREKFAKATRQSIGGQILIMTGTRLLSAPIVQSEVSGGELHIAGVETNEDVKALAVALQQQVGSVDPEDGIRKAISALDNALVKRDYQALDKLLNWSLLMGHSNAYFQTKDDVIRDLKREKITYSKIEQHSIQEQSWQDEMCRVSRIITVTGKYEGAGFSMKLAVMEIWANDPNEAGPQLWSRQAVKIKE